ncbi:hypothetical protein [Ferviditalea candida]|uniref:AAA domain-containing protein n=1 Tax=Ferviditalea candida TaxID=3108399 RepID=A0ABU5ZKH5_9BACL|nr:hypothetical protein [Paenibacillaceae bacterium T2]
MLSMVIADKDVGYLGMLSRIAGSGEFPFKLEIKCFSSKETLAFFLTNGGRPDILLIHPDLMPERELADQKCRFFRLVEEPPEEEMHNDILSISKYQPVFQLLNKAVSAYREIHALHNGRLPGNRKTNIITVYSAAGGAGNTAVSLNLAKELAARDFKVFYLNTEGVQATSALIDCGNSYDFEQIVYYFKTDKERFSGKLDRFIRHEPLHRFDCFQPSNRLEDWQAISSEDAAELIGILEDTGRYDAIIIDSDTSGHHRMGPIFRLSGTVIWLLMDDIQSIQKSRVMLKHYERILGEQRASAIANIRFVLNKYTGSLHNDFNAHSITLHGFLPYCPQWKGISQNSQLFSADEFNIAVQELVKLTGVEGNG